MSFFGELKRRNVIRVAILYFVSSWLLLQLTDVLSSLLPVPEWTGPFVFMMLLIGFVPALIFSWVYEMTPEGLKREKDVDRTASITGDTGQKINLVIVVLLILAIAGMVVDRMLPEQEPIAAPVAQATSIAPNSIAVLPFADLSAEGDQQYFTDGLSEELLNLLVRVDGLTVASRTSSFAYRDTSLGIPQIAKDLGVAHVLEGSVRKSGDRIRITAQLIEADTDRHLWSENFDRDLVDIFAIQDEIGNAIVHALKSELGFTTSTNIDVAAATSNIDAYAMYLEARELFIRRDQLTESIRLFRAAIELDPEFARAWEGLAAVEMVADDWVYTDGIDHRPLAKEAADMALSLDPGLSLPYAVLGIHAQLESHDLLVAEENFEKALEADPKNTSAWLWSGMLHRDTGNFEEAIARMENCLAIDPGYQNCRQHLALVNHIAGDTDEALRLLEASLPHFFFSTAGFFVPVYVERGDTAMATLLAAADVQDSTAPIVEWIRALQYPDLDHSAGYARWKDWESTTRTGVPLVELDNLLLAFERYEEFSSSLSSALGGMWVPEANGFRASPYFNDVVRDGGVLAYWQEKGFPGFCRPLDGDDFECDAPSKAKRRVSAPPI